NQYAPFSSKEEWEFVQWAKSEGLPDHAIDRFCKLSVVRFSTIPGLKNTRQLNQKVDELPGYGTWMSTCVTVAAHDGGSESKHEVFFRDVLACLRALWADPAFKDYMSYAPEKHYSDAARAIRLYTDIKTGDWWFEMQGKLPGGSTVVPIIISSDKTELTQFTGKATAYPIYMTVGNIADHIRRQPSRRAQILIGYLPTSSIDEAGLTELAARNARARLFHAAVRTILEPLRSAAADGIMLKSSDGAVRKCYPLLAVYAGDYPEQCLAAGVRSTRCPKCKTDQDDLSNGKLAAPRTPDDTLATLANAEQSCASLSAIDSELKQHGLNYVPEPFWKDWPHADIYRSITPDVLHQLYQGMVKHLTHWAEAIVGEDELDARMKRAGLAHGLRHFKDGITHLSRVSGEEHQAIAKQLLACMAGIPQKDAVRAARALLDFTYIAQYSCHSEATLKMLDECLRNFHRYQDVFLATEAATSLNLPKLHGLLHYAPSIRLFGTTGGYNTEQTERLHIDYAKEAYRASNHREDDMLPFMCTWLERHKKLFRFATYLADLDGQTFVALKRPPSKRVAPAVGFARHPNAKSRSIDYIQTEHGAALFSEQLVEFVKTHVRDEWTKKHPGVPVPRYEIPSPDCVAYNIWHQVKFSTPDTQTLHAPATCDIAHATPVHKTKTRLAPARFDPILVCQRLASLSWLTRDVGIRVAQLRVLFALPDEFTALFKQLRIPSPGKLAYVEWFSKPGETDDLTGMFHVRRSFRSGVQADVRQAAVIEAVDIRRSAHLVAKLSGHKPSIPLHLTVHNLYERWKEFWLNNYVDKAAYRTIY
ncbi:hypothetical protein AURDEDRAFT_72956, partial [Auricularia subglabra TFB-10046 SS5]